MVINIKESFIKTYNNITKIIIDNIIEIFLAIGIVLIFVGIFLIFKPLALIVLGLALIILAIFIYKNQE